MSTHTSADHVDAVLGAVAPDHEQAAQHTQALRGTILARATHSAERVRHRPSIRSVRRPLFLGGVAAAALAVAVSLGPNLIQSDPTWSANALTPLAQAAQTAHVPVMVGDQALYRREAYRRNGGTEHFVWETWVLVDGTSYRRETNKVTGKVAVQHSAAVASDEFTPADLAALPDSPAALLDALRTAPQAAAGGGEQTRWLLGTIIFRGYAPSPVWAAAIEALGSFEDVSVRRSATQTFVTEQAKGGPLTMVFDNATGALSGYEAHPTQDGGMHEVMTVEAAEVVAGVPAEVRAAASRLG